MQVHFGEGLANHPGPEPCGGLREGTDEKSVGARVGGVLRRESCLSRAPTLVGGWKATSRSTFRECFSGSARSETPSMRARSLGGNRESSGLATLWRVVRTGKAHADACNVRA